jgi:hypothetical protein
MSDSIAEFFQGLAQRGKEPLLNRARGTIRFDIADDRKTDRWLVALDRGEVAVSHKGGAADCVVAGPKGLFDRIALGRANAMAALLRGEIMIVGDYTLLVLFQRAFPGPRRRRVQSRAASDARRQS